MIAQRSKRHRPVFVIFFFLSWPILGIFSPVDVAAINRDISSANNLLQFRTGEHILGFHPKGLYLVSLDHALAVEFVGVEEKVEPVASGSTKTEGHPGAPLLGKVIYRDLWKGVDLNYEVAKDGIMESTYTISPGANISRIQFRYNVAVELQGDGSLRFKLPTARGYMVETEPFAWQEIEGMRVDVPVSFDIRKGGFIGFRVGAYDPRYPLIIDPTYNWHTFYGSGKADVSWGIAVDGSGNIYMTGYSFETWQGDGNANPKHAHSGSDDLFVLKLNTNGAYQWHTFYGSTSNNDYGKSIAVDAMGNVYVTGRSEGPWQGDGNANPKHAYSGNNDLFVLKLNTKGAYQWHTFYGSENNDYGKGIAVDRIGNVFISGDSFATWQGDSNANPKHAYSGNNDLFVLKLNTKGSYQWHTFYGSFGGFDYGHGIALDGMGNVYITGRSDAPWLGDDGANPIHAYSGSDEIFILKLNIKGAYQWHSFYGSEIKDVGKGIAVDGNNNVYVLGRSEETWQGDGGANPIHAHSGGGDIFVLKLNAKGAYQWHTFYRTGSFDLGWGIAGIAVDGSGDVYVTGYNDAAWQGDGGANPEYTGESVDVFLFVLKLNTDGAYQWHTLNGSGSYDIGWGIAVDGSGNIYVMGESGDTWQEDGVTNPIHSFSGYIDITVLKLTEAPLTFAWHADRMIEDNAECNGEYPQVAISGNNAVAVWAQYDGSKHRIYSNYSTDGGVSWRSDQLIEDNAEYNGESPRVAISGNNVVAVWTQFDGSKYRIYSNYSTDGGASWSSDQLIENNAGYDGEYPQVAMSGNNVVAVWRQSDGRSGRIYSNYSTDGGASWSSDQLIENNAGYDGEYPQVAMSGNNVVAVWRQSDGSSGRIYSNYSTDGGASWRSDQLIEDNAGYDGEYPQVVISGNNVVAVWAQYDGSKYRIYSNYSTDGGVSWRSDQLIEDNAEYNGEYPQVVISGNNVVAVWAQYDGSKYRIYSNYSTDGGASWRSDQLIENNAEYDGFHPQVAISGKNVVAVWRKGVPFPPLIPVPYGYYNWFIYSNYSTDGGATWRSERGVEDDRGYVDYPQVAISGKNVVAVWMQSYRGYLRIYANYGHF